MVETAKELGVLVLGYRPLGTGFLTGAIKSIDEAPGKSSESILCLFAPSDMMVKIAIAAYLPRFEKEVGILLHATVLLMIYDSLHIGNGEKQSTSRRLSNPRPEERYKRRSTEYRLG